MGALFETAYVSLIEFESTPVLPVYALTPYADGTTKNPIYTHPQRAINQTHRRSLEYMTQPPPYQLDLSRFGQIFGRR